MASDPAVAGDTFPVPLWATNLFLLTAEFSIYALWAFTKIAPRYGVGCAMLTALAFALIARLIVALASYALSRWKGSPMATSAIRCWTATQSPRKSRFACRARSNWPSRHP